MSDVPAMKPTGLFGGPQVLAIYESPHHFDLGIIADLDFAKINSHSNLNSIDIYLAGETRASLRALIGYSGFYDGSIMPYVSAGVAATKLNVNIGSLGNVNASEIKFGYAAGVGIMHSLAKYGYPNTSIYGEFVQYQFPLSPYAVTPGFGIPIQASEKTVKIGLNFKM